jgi:ferritin-like metal-binding protein YciE
MTSEQKLIQYLEEAHATEAALVQTLTAHISMTPRSEYRDLLERHLDETREHSQRILGRLSELGVGQNPIELAYGIAQTAVGQVLAAAKFPLDLLRGTGGEEKLLKNARDECATEALEIATYDSIIALAEAIGDEKTAVLAREHLAQEEQMLARLRELIPQLTRDVLAAETGGEARYDVSTTGAADAARGGAEQVQAAAREAVEDVRESVEDAADRVSRRARQAGAARQQPAQEQKQEPKQEQKRAEPAPRQEPKKDEQPAQDLPIDGYDDLAVQQLLPKLRLLTATDLAKVEAYERGNRNRKRVLDRLAQLREGTNGRGITPAGARS